MNLSRPLGICFTAARTAAGDSAEQTSTSIRAGYLAVREDPRYITIPPDPENEPALARSARVSGIDPDLDGAARLSALLDPVLDDLLERAQHVQRDAHKTALYVALPAKDAVSEAWELETFAHALARRKDLRFSSIHASRAGHTGVFTLLAEARALLARGGAESAIVAGVDSLTGVSRLRLFDEMDRLKSPRTSDGFFPGEGAALLLLESDRRIESRGGRAELSLLGIGLGAEPETVRSDKPSSGRGLTDAVRGALADGAPPHWIVSDFNGETYRGSEWGMVFARLGDRLGSIETMSYPVKSTGDVGAATGAVQIALAAAGYRRGWAPGQEVLAFACSDGAERAAVRLAKP